MTKLTFLIVYGLLSLSTIPMYSYAQKVDVFTENFPPFQTYQDNRLDGIATQKVKKILQNANLQPEFYIVPWARAFNSAKKTKNTLVFSMQRSPEREQYFHWLEVVTKIENGFVSLKKRNIKLNSLDEAKQYLTAVALDSYPYEYLISQGFSEDKNLLVVSSRETQLNLFLSGKVDFVFLDLYHMKERLLSRNLPPTIIEHALKLPEWTKELYLAINKDSDPELVNKLKSAVKKHTSP